MTRGGGPSPAYVLGVDAGNTKTIALVARGDGTILGAGRRGCGDIYAGGPGALTAIVEAAREACRLAGVAGTTPVSALSCAGADWPEDIAFLRAGLAAQGLGAPLLVVNDAVGALRGGTRAGTGVVIVCGTGAAIAARAPDGPTWHTSHWQEPQGGLQLGQKTLRAVYRAALAIDPPTLLSSRVLTYFDLTSVEALLHLCTARTSPVSPRQVAGLARLLLDTAAAGDPTAIRLVTEHGAALGDYALAAARQVGLAAAAFPLVLAGGVLRHPAPLLRETIITRVRARAPGALATPARFEPAVGALLLALEAADLAVNAPRLARLTATLPGPGLFTT